MKKQIVGLILSSTLLISGSVLAVADDTEQSQDGFNTEVELTASGTYYEQYGVYFDKSTGTITDASVEFTSFNIPEKIDGEFVTTIEDYAKIKQFI